MMKPEHGRGVATLLSWLNASVDRERARKLVDGLEDTELADVLDAVAAAHLAEGNRGGVLLESAAERLRGVDVERDGSGGEVLCEESTPAGLVCLRPRGHAGEHSAMLNLVVQQIHVPPPLEPLVCGAELSAEFDDACGLPMGHRGAHARVQYPEVA